MKEPKLILDSRSEYSIGRIKYDRSRFYFHVLLIELFGGTPLYALHTKLDRPYKELFEVGKDSSTILHKQFYDKYRAGWTEFEVTYRAFIKEVISPLYKESFLYQRFPTFRIHLPGNVCVGAFHTDASFNHPSGELNYLVPFTHSEESASLWIESRPGKKDHVPVQLTPGEIVVFNGNELEHGSRVNKTGLTRVSMDFRCLPLSKYNENHKGESVTQKTKFIIGSYYNVY